METIISAGETPLSSYFRPAASKMCSMLHPVRPHSYLRLLQNEADRLRRLVSVLPLFHQFAGIQAFSHQRLAQHNHQRAFLTVFDSSHEENLFLRIAFPLIWKARSLMASTWPPPESDHFDTIALNRLLASFFLQLHFSFR